MRKQPIKLAQLNALNGRYKMSKSLQTDYQILLSGYEGELLLDHWLNQLNYMSLKNIFVKIKNNLIQLDSVYFIDKHIIILDAKNYKGSYRYNESNLSNDQFIIKSPFHNVERTKSILKSLFPLSTIHLKIIFVNPSFKFEPPCNHKDIFLSTEKERLIHFLNQFGVSNQISISNYEKMSKYINSGGKYNSPLHLDNININPGLLCKCRKDIAHSIRKGHKYVICPYCQSKISVHQLIIQNIDEWITIYQRPINIKESQWWCKGVSRHTLYKVLNTYYLRSGDRYHFVYANEEIIKLKSLHEEEYLKEVLTLK